MLLWLPTIVRGSLRVKRANEEKPRVRWFSSESGIHWQSVLGTLAGLLLIVGVTAFFVVRTPFFKKVAAEQIGKHIGLKVDIGEIRMGWPCDVVFKEVKTKDDRQAGGALVCGEARVGLIPLGVFSRERGLMKRVSLYRLQVTLVRTKGERWEPQALADLGRVRAPEDLLLLSDRLRKDFRLKLRHGSIVWRDSNHAELGYAREVDCTTTPVKIPGRSALHCVLDAYRASFMGSASEAGLWENARPDMLNLSMEWLTMEDGKRFLVRLTEEPEVGRTGCPPGEQGGL